MASITVFLIFVFLLTRPQTTFRQLNAVSPRFKHFVSLSASENLKKYFNLGDNQSHFIVFVVSFQMPILYMVEDVVSITPFETTKK